VAGWIVGISRSLIVDGGVVRGGGKEASYLLLALERAMESWQFDDEPFGDLGASRIKVVRLSERSEFGHVIVDDRLHRDSTTTFVEPEAAARALDTAFTAS
jgi:hypothetical protein